MIKIDVHSKGVIFSVLAQPGAKANGFRGIQEGQVKIGVTQVAEKGRANKALVEYLAKQLQVAKTRVELLSGSSSRQKRFLIHGVNRSTLQSRLQVLLT